MKTRKVFFGSDKKILRQGLVRVGAFILALIMLVGSLYAGIYLVRSANVRPLVSPFVKAAEIETSVRASEVSTSAQGMCTLEMSSGRVLYEKDADAKLPMASTTKIVTAITVLDNCTDLDTPIDIDSRALGIEGTSIYLQAGEKLTVKELLYGMMLRSGNDAAGALALHVAPAGKGVKRAEAFHPFSELMNETAVKAGAVNSSFKNPHGLDEEGHYTTARDLALITAYAMRNPTFAEIVATKEIKISGKDYPRLIRNKNRLLQSTPTCVGVKTGFTKKSGRCYVGAFRDNLMTTICAVLNCGPMFEEAAVLMETADEEFTLTRVIAKDQMIDCGDGRIRGVAVEDFYYPIASDETCTMECVGGQLVVKLNGEQIYSGTYNAL